jgi:hypothetical protein
VSTMEHELPDQDTETNIVNNGDETLALAGGEQGSIIDQLVAAREEAAENTTVDIDIPGYKGALVARYGLLDNTVLAKIAKRVRRQYKRTEDQVLAMSCDILIASCEGMYHRNQETNELEPISKNGEALNYNNAGDFLQFEATSARQSVIATFANNEIAVVDHQVRLARWMRNTGVEVDSELLGE